jgi:hypothetical protein
MDFQIEVGFKPMANIFSVKKVKQVGSSFFFILSYLKKDFT